MRFRIEQYLAQFADIKEQVDELTKTSAEYEGWTTEDDEDPLFKQMIKNGEDLLTN